MTMTPNTSPRRTRPRGFVASWSPRPDTVALLEAVDRVFAEYHAYLPLTVRQIFYRLVGTTALTKTQQAYDRLQEHLSMARRAGRVPFEHIRDDGADLPADLLGPQSGIDLAAGLAARARWFELDRQIDQARLLLLWCEAAGMRPQLQRCGDPYGVQVIAGGGFDSLTAKHEMAKLITAAGRPVEILHIGDYDREGRDIFTALSEDVGAFVAAMGGAVAFARLAVTPEQIEALVLPPAPDSGAVQAEAIPPDVLAAIVDGALAERTGGHSPRRAAVLAKLTGNGVSARARAQLEAMLDRIDSARLAVTRGRSQRICATALARLRRGGLTLRDLNTL